MFVLSTDVKHKRMTAFLVEGKRVIYCEGQTDNDKTIYQYFLCENIPIIGWQEEFLLADTKEYKEEVYKSVSTTVLYSNNFTKGNNEELREEHTEYYRIIQSFNDSAVNQDYLKDYTYVVYESSQTDKLTYDYLKKYHKKSKVELIQKGNFIKENFDKVFYSFNRVLEKELGL